MSQMGEGGCIFVKRETGWGAGRLGRGLRGGKEGAVRGEWLCPRRWGAARGGPPRLGQALCAAGGPARGPQGLPRHARGGSRSARQAPLRPRRALPGGRGRLTHLLKSKGIVPSPPGVGACRPGGPRRRVGPYRLPTPPPAAPPPPPPPAPRRRRREVTLRAAHWTPRAGKGRGRGGPFGVKALGGEGSPQRGLGPLPAPHGVVTIHGMLQVWAPHSAHL